MRVVEVVVRWAGVPLALERASSAALACARLDRATSAAVAEGALAIEVTEGERNADAPALPTERSRADEPIDERIDERKVFAFAAILFAGGIASLLVTAPVQDRVSWPVVPVDPLFVRVRALTLPPPQLEPVVDDVPGIRAARGPAQTVSPATAALFARIERRDDDTGAAMEGLAQMRELLAHLAEPSLALASDASRVALSELRTQTYLDTAGEPRHPTTAGGDGDDGDIGCPGLLVHSVILDEVVPELRPHRTAPIVDSFAVEGEAEACPNRDSIRKSVETALPPIRACFNALSAGGSGKIMTRFRIAPDGHVVDTEIVSTTFADARLGECTMGALRHLHMEACGGDDEVLVNFPFIFESAGE